MTTDGTNQNDWSNEQAYRDFATYLHCIADSLKSADISSRTGNLVDGHVYYDVLNKLKALEEIFNKPEDWLYVREPRTITRGQGKVNN